MKIALASTNGTHVDEHFGRAEIFYIYDLSDAGPVKSAEVSVTPLSIGDKNHPFDPDRLQGITDALQGCERVYITKIGERPAAELVKIGIEPVVFQGAIKDIRE